MNGTQNFLINKSTKEVGGDITGTTIDDNNRKTKKIRWTEIRAVHLDRGSIYHAVQVQPSGAMASGGHCTRKDIVFTKKLQANCWDKKFLDCKYNLIVMEYRKKISSILCGVCMKNNFSVLVLITIKLQNIHSQIFWMISFYILVLVCFIRLYVNCISQCKNHRKYKNSPKGYY